MASSDSYNKPKMPAGLKLRSLESHNTPRPPPPPTFPATKKAPKRKAQERPAPVVVADDDAEEPNKLHAAPWRRQRAMKAAHAFAEETEGGVACDETAEPEADIEDSHQHDEAAEAPASPALAASGSNQEVVVDKLKYGFVAELCKKKTAVLKACFTDFNRAKISAGMAFAHLKKTEEALAKVIQRIEDDDTVDDDMVIT